MSLKKALATLLATVMMLSLVSCGSKSNEEAPTTPPSPRNLRKAPARSR